ncbi:MAG: nitroreductase family protein [Oscillospiraceae bacterium]|nr:nitroreductase family protein [Oscillospiraceae bacterium]
MNEVLKTIKERFSCRDFTGEPLTDDMIKQIADAALAAPSARNLMPWQVIIVTDKSLIDETDDEGVRIMASDPQDKYDFNRISSRGGRMLYNAPCMVIISADPGVSGYVPIDCGILAENIALAAASLGLGSVICGLAAVPLNGPRGAELKKRLRFPAGHEFVISVLVGTAKSKTAPHEPDPGKITYI